MEKQVNYNTAQVKGFVLDIVRQMYADKWSPDCIVGITRGGLLPAIMLSHYLNVPMETLMVSLRDNDDRQESNLWLAEQAFGYIPNDGHNRTMDETARKNILIIDDINDTGNTFNWIINDWQGGCCPQSGEWDSIWHNNVRFAALINNEASKADIDYSGININKASEPQWCVFPWEEWWLEI